MNATILLIVALVIIILGYVLYGRWLAKKWGIDPSRPTPAVEINDGVDYIPTKSIILFGHHFSSIAGAGPITGPIQAAVFGWIPVTLWVLIGGIFFGGPHDMGSLLFSIRNKGKSFYASSDKFLGKRSKGLLILFFYFCVVLVISAFFSIVANSFVYGSDSSTSSNLGPQVATISMLLIPFAVIFGVFINRYHPSLLTTVLVGLSFVFLTFIIGYNVPLTLSYNGWVLVLTIYIIVASILPVWLLLQPRDFLCSFLLYGVIILSFFAILFSGPEMRLPAFTEFETSLGFLFPAMFITIACGAVSGSHALVTTGTTSKQIESEADIRKVGYGAMLVESLLAVIALIAVGTLFTTSMPSGTPLEIFASGITNMLDKLGLSNYHSILFCFLMLAVSAFVLTSLDTFTRIGSYMVKEYASTKDNKILNKFKKPIVATLTTVLLSTALSFIGYQSLWSVFGTLNQLIAAFTLIIISSWLAYIGREYRMLVIPTIFMFACTLSMLVYLVYSKGQSLIDGGFDAGNFTIFIICFALLIGSIYIIYDELKFLRNKHKETNVV